MKKQLLAFCLLVIVTSFAATSFAQRKHTSKAKKPARAKSTMLALLQGRWASLDDKKTFFEIRGNRQTDIYGKNILDTATVNFYDDCPETISATEPARQNGKHLVVAISPNDFSCYDIQTLTASQLALIYLPRGNLLRYKKVKAVKK